jgi:hypothetical protein
MDFRENLLQTISEWSADPIVDEWVFENFRQNVVKQLTSADAFDAIDPAIDILLAEVDESTSIEIVQTILSLVVQSDTTEVPRNLVSNIGDIQGKFLKFGPYAQSKLRELLGKYRL